MDIWYNLRVRLNFPKPTYPYPIPDKLDEVYEDAWEEIAKGYEGDGTLIYV